MVNIFDVQKSLQFKWISLLCKQGNGAWRILPTRYFDKLGKHFIAFNMNTSFNSLRGIDGYFPTFYKRLLKEWLDTPDRNPERTFENSAQIIWNNDRIKYKGNSLYLRRWIDSGIIYLCDVVDSQNFVAYEKVADLLGDSPLTQFEYNIVKNALSKDILQITHQMGDYKVYFNNCPVSNVKAKIIRQFYVHARLKSVSERYTKYWANKFDLSLSSSYWGLAYCTTKEVRLITLQWKILHCIFPTRKLLHKMKITDCNKCLLCNVIDTIEHYFVKCCLATQIWYFVEKDIEKIIWGSVPAQ